jgi:hypothetical protein
MRSDASVDVGVQSAMKWWSRQQARQFDLQRGVDADLVAENRRRVWRALGLIVVGIVIMIVSVKLHLAGWPARASTWIGTTFFIVGFLVLRWAGAERAFLNEPEPEKPPSLFGDR